MKLAKIIEGKHNKQSFRFERGFLVIFGRKWDKADIQTLIEVANLLSIEGYDLKIPVRVEEKTVDSMFGGTYKVDNKIYDESEEE